MKKVLALILAAMMVAGTASMAFATSGVESTITTESGAKAEFAEENIYYTWSGDYSRLKPGGNVKQGTTIYFKLKSLGYSDKDMEKLKVKGEWTNGGSLVEDTKVEYKRELTNPDYVEKKEEPHYTYGYFVAVYTKAESTVAVEDLTGELKLYKSSPNNEISTLKVNFGTASHKSIKFVEDVEDTASETDDYTVYDSKSKDYIPVIKFEKDLGDITIEFDQVGQFDINVDDQEKLYLGYNFDAKSDIADKYSYAELNFVNFLNAPKFNRNGTFYLYADEGSFLYALKDGKLEAVKTTYDSEYEALKFTVKQFPDSWIISDTELEIVNDETSSSEAPAEGETTPSETVKPNPGTGR